LLWKVIFIVVYVKMGSYFTMAAWKWHGMKRHGNAMEMIWHGNGKA
jgi:hypothetical protein